LADSREFQYILSLGVELISLNIQQECVHSLMVVEKSYIVDCRLIRARVTVNNIFS
jgi:hypothetical protein